MINREAKVKKKKSNAKNEVEEFSILSRASCTETVRRNVANFDVRKHLLFDPVNLTIPN